MRSTIKNIKKNPCLTREITPISICKTLISVPSILLLVFIFPVLAVTS